MSHDPLAPAGRKNRRRQLLGPDARCGGCGIANPTILNPPKRSLLEAHHPFGEAHAPDLTVPMCRNCHAVLSAYQVDEEVPLQPQSTLVERVKAILEALIALFKGAAELLVGLAVLLVRFIDGLDAEYPGWRTKPWAA